MKKHNSHKSKAPSLSERRQIENEVVFRKANEKIQKGFDNIERLAKEEDFAVPKPDPDMILHFYCECSDENCRQRITMPHSKYKEIHKDRSQFIVQPGHATKALEEVVSKRAKYNVVDKFVTPPETSTGLNATSISNA